MLVYDGLVDVEHVRAPAVLVDATWKRTSTSIVDGIPTAQRGNDGYFEPDVTDFRVVEKFEAGLFEKP
jgi:hypothetical protein